MEKTKKARAGGKLRGIRELLGVFGAFALIFVLLSVIPGVSEKFLAPSNLFNIARQITVNIVLACGLTMAILIGGIDLSVGSVIAISGCLVGGLMTNNGLPVYAAIAIGLASGAVFGAVNGLVISRTNIPPFIVTLATMYVGRGIVRLYTDSSTILITDDVFSYIGSGKLFGVVPIQIIYIVVLCLVSLVHTEPHKVRPPHLCRGRQRAGRAFHRHKRPPGEASRSTCWSGSLLPSPASSTPRAPAPGSTPPARATRWTPLRPSSSAAPA